VLCKGRVYALYTNILFKSDKKYNFDSLIDGEGEETDFLDDLILHGLLKFKQSMKDNVKSMLLEESPFYEVNFLLMV
jgi:hypothetical protein